MPAHSVAHIAKYPARKQSVEFSGAGQSVASQGLTHRPAFANAEIATPSRQQWRHSGALSFIVVESYENHRRKLAAKKRLAETTRPGNFEAARTRSAQARRSAAMSGNCRRRMGPGIEYRHDPPVLERFGGHRLVKRYCGSLMTYTNPSSVPTTIISPEIAGVERMGFEFSGL